MRAEKSTESELQANPSESLEAIAVHTSEPGSMPCGLTSLAEKLAHDSAFDWLVPLSEMLGVISQRTDRSDRVIRHYRLLITVSAELAKSLFAIRSQLAYSDFSNRQDQKRHASGLPRWQVRRAREFLAAHIGADISVDDVAAVCGLSRAYFTSAFGRATGVTPHRCLMRYRIERAKTLLAGPLTIADIALQCGFADQSHLTRVFAKQTGIPPGVWRREQGSRTEGKEQTGPTFLNAGVRPCHHLESTTAVSPSNNAR
jgi:AraC-like DNA-binding protein